MAEDNLIWFYGRVWTTFYRDIMRDDHKSYTRDELIKMMVDAYNYEADINGIGHINPKDTK
jgi:hypothetical protein